MIDFSLLSVRSNDTWQSVTVPRGDISTERAISVCHFGVHQVIVV
jgi:hypothetical protein